MKILHVITGLRQSGAETALYRLIHADDIHEHYVISLGELDYYGDKLLQLGVRVTALQLGGNGGVVRGLLALRRHMRQYSPDVIQTWMYHADLLGGLIARLSVTAPVFWGIRRANTRIHRRFSSIWFLLRLNSLLSYLIPHGIVCCAQAAQQSHARMGYSIKKMHVIHNGFDTDLFRPNVENTQSLLAQLGIKSGTRVLGSIGRWLPEKNYPGLLDALVQLETDSSWICVLAGHGLEQSNTDLVAAIAERQLQNRVLLLGSRNDIPDIMNALTIYVLPSLGEGFPNVVGEAMACGVPCVVTDAGDAAVIVDTTGWVVEVDNPGHLANALATSLQASHDDNWNARKQQCRLRIVDQFSINTMALAFHRLWSGH